VRGRGPRRALVPGRRSPPGRAPSWQDRPAAPT